jgi:hypothetical protein
MKKLRDISKEDEIMNAKTLLYKARQHMKPEEIQTGCASGSDLYLKVTPVSEALIAKYDFKGTVTKFIDCIDHKLWYDIPFANTDWWESKGCYCGEIEE